MSTRTRMWLQLVAAACFAVAVLMELAGLTTTFEGGWGTWVMSAAALAMLYEAWRSRRKMKSETNES